MSAVLVNDFVSVLQSETEESDAVIDGGRRFRKPDENVPLSSSESGFAELVQHPVPHFAVPFKSSTRKLAKDLFEGRHYKNDVLQNQSICIYSKTDSEIKREISSFWTLAGG